MSGITVEPIRLLLVEDDEADILLAQRAFERANIWNKVDVVRDGRETLEYLRNQGAYADKTKYPRPGIILLDLNLPGVDGREVLDTMYKDPNLKSIPVVIVSTSDYERDIEYGRARDVQHYIIKPIQVDNILETCSAVHDFRIVLARVPA
ncbi:MAG: Response regulator rcp1 [Verrucomicrobia bacterium ADurb.Bin345]|nr:MAG: Response regulator rcp1 [Verrucomicrobia bacterium ADurb.Bin345]